MILKPMLGDWEIPRIQSIETLEHRSFVEFAVPGRVGSLFQDMNTTPTRLAISGSLYGDEARSEFLETLRERFRAGEPVTFVADIVTATAIQYVLIETLHMQENGTRPDEMQYYIVMIESPPPPPPPDPLAGLDTGLLDQAGDFLDSVTGALGAIEALGSVPNFGDPTPPLQGTLQGVTSALQGLGGVTSALTELFGGGE